MKFDEQNQRVRARGRAPLMNFVDQDRQLRFLVARASSPCFGQAGSLSHHFLTDNHVTDFACQISSDASFITGLGR
jgi:hypothetical protein